MEDVMFVSNTAQIIDRIAYSMLRGSRDKAMLLTLDIEVRKNPHDAGVLRWQIFLAMYYNGVTVWLGSGHDDVKVYAPNIKAWRDLGGYRMHGRESVGIAPRLNQFGVRMCNEFAPGTKPEDLCLSANIVDLHILEVKKFRRSEDGKLFHLEY
jgi:hypothetical protein